MNCRPKRETMLRFSSFACIGLSLATVLLPAHLPADSNNAGGESSSFSVNIRVDAAHQLGEWRPVWRFFGADEPNYAYMKDGKKLLTELGTLRFGEVYFRTHNLLTSGDGTPASKMGINRCLSRGCQSKTHLRLDHRRPSFLDLY